MVTLAYKFYPHVSDSQTKTLLTQTQFNFLILHGLFGSSKNWVSISKFLSEYGNVYSLDLRNHGDSPHVEDHSIPSMAQDIGEFIGQHGLKDVVLLGHSMGGLVSMYYDLTNPGVLKKLIIQDISPRAYPFVYEREIEAMSIPLDGLTSRVDIDTEMKKILPNDFIRQFLQMSLERNEDGSYRWKLNVPVLGSQRKLFDSSFSDLKPSFTETYFILGDSSEYIEESDLEKMNHYFPNSVVEKIAGGGHYIHYTHQEDYITLLAKFLKRN